jgi:hypothetical protein
MGRPRPQLDTSRLPIPDIVVAGGALLALIFSFLHWYKVEIFGFGIGASGRGGYQNWPMIIYLLLLIFAGGDWEFVKMNWAIWIIMIIISLIPIAGGFMKMQQSG